jgi:hypothetical protein
MSFATQALPVNGARETNIILSLGREKAVGSGAIGALA